MIEIEYRLVSVRVLLQKLYKCKIHIYKYIIEIKGI